MGRAVVSLVVGLAGGVSIAAGVALRTPPLAARGVEPAAGSTHLALPGRAVLFKAVLPSLRPGHLLRCRWEFGDGDASAEEWLEDPRAIACSHVYPEAGPGARFEARLRVIDTTRGEEALAAYPVEVVEPTVDHRRAVALEDGLWALHASMSRREDALHGPMGCWNGDHPVGITAMCALAFMVNGFDLRPERADHPYSDTIDRALRYLASRIVTCEGQPGALTVPGNRPMYEVPLLVMALVATQAPDRPLPGANPELAGLGAREVVRRLLASIARCQRGPEHGPQQGGWRYGPLGGDADLSVTQWPALAFRAAEEVWGIETPDAVKAGLEGYLRRAQRPDGGFAYQLRGDATLRMTGAGLIALACAGVPGSDPRVIAAREAIGRWWDARHVQDDYGMYAVMKGALLTSPRIERFGAHEWRAEYVASLASRQLSDGTWPTVEHAPGALATAWPTLILADDVFCSARPLDWRALVWLVAGCGGLWGLASALFTRRLWRAVP